MKYTNKITLKIEFENGPVSIDLINHFLDRLTTMYQYDFENGWRPPGQWTLTVKEMHVEANGNILLIKIHYKYDLNWEELNQLEQYITKMCENWKDWDSKSTYKNYIFTFSGEEEDTTSWANCGVYYD